MANKYKGVPKVELSIDGILTRAELDGLYPVDSEIPKAHFILEKTKYDNTKNKIMIVTPKNGYLLLTKDEALTIADELYILAKDYL